MNINNMNFTAFVRVAEAGSFNKAAESLYITSTALIKQINLLESELGLRLFNRSHRGLTLTKAGESLYKDAKYIIEYSRESVERAKAAMLEETQIIRIGTSPVMPAQMLMDLWPKIIEKHFDLINIDMAALPGKVEKDFRQRCARDYRLESALDLYEFTAIIIRCVLQYNNYHYMEAFRKTRQMRQLHVKPIPRDVWDFGIRYMSGGLRTMDREQVRYHLLPKGEASVTRMGIRFDGRYYTCDQAEQERWYDLARSDSSWKVTAAYDPRDAGLIYISPTSGASPVKCRLLPKGRVYEGTSTEEARRIAAFDHEEQAAYAPTEDFHRIQLEEFIEKTKADALAKLPPAPKKSKAARVSEIEANRKKEKEAIRERNTAETMNRQGILPESEKDATGPQAVSPITRMLQEALDNALKGGSNDSNNS